MIVDTIICDFLIKRRIDFKIILLLMSFYYIVLYTLIYNVLKRAFAPQNILIPSLIILIPFFIYRIISINKYAKSKI
jgi:hypothetical protein